MSTRLRSLLFSVLLASSPLLAASPGEDALPGLVAAERGFAADAQRLGVHDAFVAHLDPQAWLFRPQPVRAQDWFASHPGRPGTLEWLPEFAEVAGSGDFGYTYGPWHSTAPGEQGERQAWGHFFSVWKRGSDGVWKNVLDHGFAHAEVPLKVTLAMRAPHARPPRLVPAEVERRRVALLALDDALSGKDAEQALQAQRAAGQVRHFRDGIVPSIEAAAARPPVATGLKRVAYERAASADLAYTLGARADGKADGEGGYVRVWRYQTDHWQLAVDLLTPPN